MSCLTLPGCLLAPTLIALQLRLCLPLQAYPFQHAIFDLSRLPAGSMPAFGSTLPFNMVSSSLLIRGLAVGVGVHQLWSALPCRRTLMQL